MSSTNRGSEREPDDYYATPLWCIENFIKEFQRVTKINLATQIILDPCAGGDEKNPAAYPEVLRQFGATNITTIDIRENSKADVIEDYLNAHTGLFDLIISNPPFNLATAFVEKGLEDLIAHGYVVYLLRLNILGSIIRKDFWASHPPTYVFVTSKRPAFLRGKSDSCEYAHFVWQKDFTGVTKMYII